MEMAAELEMLTIVVKACKEADLVGDDDDGSRPKQGKSSSSTSASSPSTTTVEVAADFDEDREGSIEIPKAWLASPWFEAKLERWQEADDELPQITLDIPRECDAKEGARLLEQRLRATFEASDCSWTSLEWWRATNGQVAALSAALHIFHMTLMEKEAKEVAVALKHYGLLCRQSTCRVAGALEVEVAALDLPRAPFQVGEAELQKMISDACKVVLEHPKKCNTSEDCERCKGFLLLADRAMAAVSPTSELIGHLVSNFFGCFTLHLPEQSVFCGAGDRSRQWSVGVEKPSSPQGWLVKHIVGLLRSRPEGFVDVGAAIRSNLSKVQATVRVRHFSQRGKLIEQAKEPLALEEGFVRDVLDLVTECLNALFIDSTLRPESSEKIVSALCSGVKSVFPLFFRGPADNYWVYSPDIRGDFFAVASPRVQSTFLSVLPHECYGVFSDQVHLVHEDVRHVFVSQATLLSAADLKFLSMATFPGLDRRCGSEEPPAKKAKT